MEEGPKLSLLRTADNITEAEEFMSASNKNPDKNTSKDTARDSSKNRVEKTNKDTNPVEEFCKQIGDFYKGKPTNKKKRFSFALLHLLFGLVRPLAYSILLFISCIIFLEVAASRRSLRDKII